MQVLNGICLLLLIAGQFELLVAVVNRAHSLPIRSTILRQLRHAHDALLLVFPVLLIGWVGLWRPGVLLGGSWSELSLPWTIWLSLCALGSVSLLLCALRWQLRVRPAALVSDRSEVVRFDQQGTDDLIGTGQFQYLTRVPGNEFLHVDFSEKTYQLATGLGELRILHLTDFHFTGIPSREFYVRAIEQLRDREFDLVVFTGDLLDEPALVQWIPETLGQLKARFGCYYILGNHDWTVGDTEVRSLFDASGWTDLAGRAIDVPGADGKLAIGGSEAPWMGRQPAFRSTRESATRILLSHTPDNLQWARGQDVQLMLSGHNHGGQVILPVIGPVYSPSRYGVRYSGGDFFESPTLLHVCRGLGARHPLRLNCRPEIATIVLQDPA